MITKAAKRIFNSGKICRSHSDLNFGVTFLEHSVYCNVTFDIVLHLYNISYTVLREITADKTSVTQLSLPTLCLGP